MALQLLESSGVWVPSYPMDGPSISSSNYVIDASGEKAVLVLRCPRAGVIDRFDFLVGAVANSPDNGLRASLQTVDATTGQNTGTLLGATNNAAVTYAHTVTTGWKSTNFAETATVTRGQMVACVVDIPSFTVGDSVSLSSLNWNIAHGMPYGISASTSKQAATHPLMALHYTDGYAFLAPHCPGIDTQTFVTYNSGTAVADEWGLGFQVPWPCTLSAISVYVGTAAAASDFEVIVYNSADSIVGIMTYDGDINPGTGLRSHTLWLDAPVNLTKNSTYRVTLRPTSANGINLTYWTFQSADLMHTMEGGDNFYMTSRLNQAGAWTDYHTGTFRRPRMALHLTAFDDAVSAGGASAHVFAA